MVTYVGLFGHSAVVFNVFKCFFSCFYVLLTVWVVVFFSVTFFDLFSCIAASLFNKLTYLLTYGTKLTRSQKVERSSLEVILGRSINQSINLLKAKGPIGHLHRSKIHNIKYIKYINTHSSLICVLFVLHSVIFSFFGN